MTATMGTRRIAASGATAEPVAYRYEITELTIGWGSYDRVGIGRSVSFRAPGAENDDGPAFRRARTSHRAFAVQAMPAAFATSVAKSSFFFSRPSPSSKRAKRRILMFSPIFAMSSCWSCSIVLSGFFTNG